MAISRTGRGSFGELDRALTSSQTGPPNFGKCSQGFPRPDQPAGIVNRCKTFEICFDALAHIIVELALLGIERGGRHQG
jgi:hypothetical protein